MVILIKEVLSEDNRYKIAIYQRSDGLFEVETCRWTQDTDPESGFRSDFFWEPCTGRPLTDTFEKAQLIAQEELRALSGEVPNTG